VGGIILTNTSTHAINGFVDLGVSFSAFNPGGPGVGIGIDDALTQAASFTSGVGGDGEVGDRHSCSVGFLGQSGAGYSPTTCGVNWPDSSFSHTGRELNDFLPGMQMLFTWGASISATFDLGEAPPAEGVPEPRGVFLFAVGLLALLVLRRNVRARN